MEAIDPIDLRLLDEWQRDFPLLSRPYAVIGRVLGIGEEAVIDRLRALQQKGYVSRIGAVFRPHVLGASTLAAVSVPPARVEEAAALINAYPEVNHNYEREHHYNLWFVLTAADSERIAQVLAEIGRRLGTLPLDLPMLADYHIDLGFRLGAHRTQRRSHLEAAGGPQQSRALRDRLVAADYALAAALEPGLALVPAPYAHLAAACGMQEGACIDRLRRLLALGVIRRFGVVVRHRELGYRANAMVVWDVPDAEVDRVGRALARQPAVSLCYRRPRRRPHWPYNLFTLLHGHSRGEVLAELAHLRETLGLAHLACAPLFSLRRFKQCGARYRSHLPMAA